MHNNDNSSAETGMCAFFFNNFGYNLRDDHSKSPTPELTDIHFSETKMGQVLSGVF